MTQVLGVARLDHPRLERLAEKRQQTVVLIHGMLGGAHSYRRVIEAFKREWPTRVSLVFVTPKVMGHEPEGLVPSQAHKVTSVPHGAVANDGFEAEVQRLLTGIEGTVSSEETDVHLVGYSLGGRLAIGMASVFPTGGARLCSLTVVGAHPGLADPIERQQRALEDEQHAKQLELEGMRSFLDYWQERPIFASQKALPRPLLDAERAARLQLDPTGIALAFRTLGLGRMPNYRESLGRLVIPVHWVAGELDSKFRNLAEEMVQVSPTAQHHIVPGVGHNVLLEAPHWLGTSLSKWIQEASLQTS